MNINFQKCTEEQMWKFIAHALAQNGVDVILVGGAVVSIYTNGAYRSGDLDFVLNEVSRKKLDKTLLSLNFIKDRRFYKHPECKHLFLEFADFPVGIGNDYQIKPDEVPYKGEVLKIYSPTDCVRDRLASFAFFGARECLDQAVLVANAHEVDFRKVKKWCKQENILECFSQFISKLKV